jgi:hypothetical protein
MLAPFPAVKELLGFYLAAQPSIDPKQIRELAASRWIPNGENVCCSACLASVKRSY